VLEAGARDAGVAIRTGSRLEPEAAEGLVIGADGLHSRLRAALNGAAPFFTGQVAWRALVSDPEAAPEVQVFMGPRRHLVTYPLAGACGTSSRWRSAPAGPRRAGTTRTIPTICARLRRFRARRGAGLTGSNRSISGASSAIPVAARWHDGTRAILGDAAHPTLPFLAQGANMALEDAWVLADRLDRLPREEALARLSAARRDRVARVIAAATPMRGTTTSNPLLRLAAHAALRLGGTLAPAAPLRRFDWIYGTT
jgi:salicylate hydroxylase